MHWNWMMEMVLVEAPDSFILMARCRLTDCLMLAICTDITVPPCKLRRGLLRGGIRRATANVSGAAAQGTRIWSFGPEVPITGVR